MRKWGCEIECVIPAHDRQMMANMLNAAGVPSRVTNVQDYDYSDGVLKIKTDISVRGTGHTMELCLAPSRDFDTLRKVLVVLADVRAIVNMSTGLHITLDMSDMPRWKAVECALRFDALYPQISMALPPSRRTGGQGYTYCQRYSNTERTHYENIIRTGSNNVMWVDKYRHCNLSKLCRAGLMEVRCAAGSTDLEKIRMWVRFLDAFIASTLRKRNAIDTPAPQAPAVVDMEGVTGRPFTDGGRQGQFAAMLTPGRIVNLEEARIALGLSRMSQIKAYLRDLVRNYGWAIEIGRSGGRFVTARRRGAPGTFVGATPESNNSPITWGNITDDIPADVCAWVFTRMIECAPTTMRSSDANA